MGKRSQINQTKGRQASTERDVQFELCGVHFRVIDEVWYGYFKLAKQRSSPENPVSVRAVRDEAIAWFLNQIARGPYEGYLPAPKSDITDQMFWMESASRDRAAEFGDRDGVSRNRVLMTALYRYLEHVKVRADATDIAQFKELQEKNEGRSWRLVRKKGSRYRSRGERDAAAKRSKKVSVAKKKK